LLELKSDPGRLGLETLLEKIVKLRRAKALGLPGDLFGGFCDKLVASWRARAMASHPSDLAANQPPVRLTLVSALVWSRASEITDALVDLFIGLVSKIGTRAVRKVDKAMEAEARKVHRKIEKLFSIAEASLRKPDGTVRTAVRDRVAEGRIAAPRNLRGRGALVAQPGGGPAGRSGWGFPRWRGGPGRRELVGIHDGGPTEDAAPGPGGGQAGHGALLPLAIILGTEPEMLIRPPSNVQPVTPTGLPWGTVLHGWEEDGSLILAAS
jgi:hypothetical protein